jgi:HD superfamily phosphohydrolase YqeK
MLSVQEMLPDIITEDCEMWLKSIGFYDKPASIHHHGTNNGDLYLHCVEVARALCGLSEKLGLVWQRKESPMLVGLLHDVCKCDDYISNGWEDDHEIWKYNESKTMGGHGDKSVIMLSGHMQLTEEEMYCIRFHMGAFTDKEEWKYYSKAVNKYPNVLYTHTADMIASQINNI